VPRLFPVNQKFGRGFCFVLWGAPVHSRAPSDKTGSHSRSERKVDSPRSPAAPASRPRNNLKDKGLPGHRQYGL
jgi:hypothetical protein